jgi:tellurite resistance protein
MGALDKISDSLKDPGAAAARGRWLARGAWLLAAAEVVVAVRDHIAGRLDEKERGRMVEIVRSSKGRPSNLSDRERKELRALLGKIEPRELLKTVGTTGVARRFRGRLWWAGVFCAYLSLKRAPDLGTACRTA